MKFTIFSTLCLGFSSAALAATVPEEATHQLAQRQMRDRLRARSTSNEGLFDVESFEGSEVAEPQVKLEARRRVNFSGTCNRNNHMCYLQWTEGQLTWKGNCYCKSTTCSTNSGYCTYNDDTKDCVCT